MLVGFSFTIRTSCGCCVWWWVGGGVCEACACGVCEACACGVCGVPVQCVCVCVSVRKRSHVCGVVVCVRCGVGDGLCVFVCMRTEL